MPLAAPPATAPPSVAMAASTRALLEAPVLPTLLRLAAPNVVVMVAQAAITTFDAFVLGWLGPEALAGVALTFPLVMLLQTMSAGGMGGGVASAVARALGGGRRADAEAIVVHAAAIAITMGTVFAVAMLAFGPALYRAMGGTGGTLDAAIAYSTVTFAGAMAPWLFNTLSAVVRGTGQMSLPATIFVGAAAMHLVLSPALVFGWGPMPRVGVAGGAVSMLCTYCVGVAILAGYLVTGRGLVRPSLHGLGLRLRLFGEILKVGAPASLNTVQTNLSVLLLTALVGPFGTAVLAGYGVGARLEYLQIPLVFGFGSALVTMVGTNTGAGQRARARRVAWIGAGLAAGVTEAIGLGAALFPRAWLGLFTTDPAVMEAGVSYLRLVGPAYGFFGLGLALYFASQGAGRMLWPLLAGFFRMTTAALGGWVVVHWLGLGLPGLFVTMAIAMVIFGSTVAIALTRGAGDRGRRPETPPAQR